MAQTHVTGVTCGDFSTTSDPTVDDDQEKACIGKLNGVAARNGCKLLLQLENGTKKTYEDRSRECGLPEDQESDVKYYRLLAWFPAAHVFIIEVGFYESAAAIILSSRSGEEQKSWTGLHLSPDGKTIAEINNQDGDSPADYAIAIWDLDVEPARVLLKLAPDTYEVWEFKGWRGSSTVLASVSRHSQDPDHHMVTYDAEITRDTSNKWTVQVIYPTHPK